MKKILLTVVFFAMACVAVNGQNTAYAQLNGQTLTFKYGTIPTSGTIYSVPLNSTSYSDLPWYANREDVTKVVFDQSFSNVDNIVSFCMWFANMKNLTQIQGIQNLNTSHAINMMSMFAFTALTSLDLSSFDTQNVETMQGMFAGSTKLYSLDLSNFNTANLTNTSYMFSMNYLEPILTTIDMSSFDMSKVTTTDGMFQGNNMLKTIYCNSDCSSSTVLASSTNMFNGCTRIVGGNGTTYDTSHIDASYARPDIEGTKGYFTGQSPEYIETHSLNTAVYPNPINDSNMTVACGEQARVAVYSTDGRCIYDRNVNDTAVIDTDNWQSGAYIVTIETKTETKIHKVVKL